MPDPNLIEAMARGMWETEGWLWHDAQPETVELYTEEASRALIATCEGPHVEAMKRRAAVHLAPDGEDPSDDLLDRVELMLRAALLGGTDD